MVSRGALGIKTEGFRGVGQGASRIAVVEDGGPAIAECLGQLRVEFDGFREFRDRQRGHSSQEP